MLSIVIPTLNEAVSIRATLDAAGRIEGDVEVIVVDGGSVDDTVSIARQCGVRVLSAATGRGPQMHAGATVAGGDAVWFLHADSLPPANAAARIAEALCDPNVVGGNFTVIFDGNRRAARFLTWIYPHLRKLGLFYGDSAIFVRRKIYEEVGGFQPLPIFEDLDLIGRLKQHGQMAHLPDAVVSSSRRFEKRSFTMTFVRATALQLFYWMGIPPRSLYRFYPAIRSEP